MKVLGIETSCDETGVAVYDTQAGLRAHCLHSQIDLHAAYGGVVPELASRDHIRRLPMLLTQTLELAGLVAGDIDAVVLTTGCDKTTPAGVMAASTVDIPTIVLSGGPMLGGWHEGQLVGSGTVIWRSRRQLAAGEIDEEEFLQRACNSAPSAGHCNTMGTASTMNAVAEALGLSLPGNGTTLATHADRERLFRDLGGAAVEMESGALGQVAEAFAIPYLDIRALSDLAGRDSRFDFAAFVSEVAGSSARILRHLLPVL